MFVCVCVGHLISIGIGHKERCQKPLAAGLLVFLSSRCSYATLCGSEKYRFFALQKIQKKQQGKAGQGEYNALCVLAAAKAKTNTQKSAMERERRGEGQRAREREREKGKETLGHWHNNLARKPFFLTQTPRQYIFMQQGLCSVRGGRRKEEAGGRRQKNVGRAHKK